MLRVSRRLPARFGLPLRQHERRPVPCSAAALLLAVLIAGCAPSQAGPASVLAAAPAATAAVSPAAARPVEDLSPDPAVLLQAAVERHERVRTVRGLIELDVRGEGSDTGEPITTTIEFEYAKPNVRLTGMQRPSAPPRVDMILTDEAAYVKAEDKWLATTPGSRPTEVKLLGFDRLTSFLETAVEPRLMAPREVGGVPCEVLSFELAPEKVQELADLAAFKRAAREGVTIDQQEAEVVLGSDDGRIRDLSLLISGHDNAGAKSPFVQRATVDLWDFDAPDISVDAPPQAELLDLGKLLPPNATPASQ